MSSNERWTQHAIRARIQKWSARYGQPPKLLDWRHSGADEDGAYPSETTVKAKFHSWNAAINDAGLSSRSIGRPGNYTVEGSYVTDTSTTNSVADQSAVSNAPVCYCQGAQSKLNSIKALLEAGATDSIDLQTIITIIDA